MMFHLPVIRLKINSPLRPATTLDEWPGGWSCLWCELPAQPAASTPSSTMAVLVFGRCGRLPVIQAWQHDNKIPLVNRHQILLPGGCCTNSKGNWSTAGRHLKLVSNYSAPFKTHFIGTAVSDSHMVHCGMESSLRSKRCAGPGHFYQQNV